MVLMWFIALSKVLDIVCSAKLNKVEADRKSKRKNIRWQFVQTRLNLFWVCEKS
jgi:hypothetical protein